MHVDETDLPPNGLCHIAKPKFRGKNKRPGTKAIQHNFATDSRLAQPVFTRDTMGRQDAALGQTHRHCRADDATACDHDVHAFHD